MKTAALWVTVLLIGAAVGAAWVYQSVREDSDSDAVVESDALEAGGSGQFKQQVPANIIEVGSDPDTSFEDAQGSSESAAHVVVSMTDAGFTPSEVIIASGQTVTFVNNGQALHWPASDVHPTHEVLAEFDSEAGVATGEGYSFTFEEVGTWHFHDHLFPQFTGTVTVE